MATMTPERAADRLADVDLESLMSAELPPCAVEIHWTCSKGHDHGTEKCAQPSVTVAHIICSAHGNDGSIPMCAVHRDEATREVNGLPCGMKGCKGILTLEFS